MTITADLDCFLTEVAEVSLSERSFKSMVIVSSPEEAGKWRQISAEEKVSLEAQKAIFENQDITPDYLQKVNLLLSGIKGGINDKPFSSEDALKYKNFYPLWDEIIGKEINAGFCFQCDDSLFEALQTHKVSAENKPSSIMLMKALSEKENSESVQLYKLVTVEE